MSGIRVVHVTPYFAPAYVYGGPPRSIHALCRALSSGGVEVDVVTTTANGRADFDPTPPEGELVDGVRVHRVPRRWPRWFFNAPVRAPLADALAHADLCHVHGLWNRPEWAAAAESRARRLPYIVSPRGMLLDSALAHHARRKRVAFDAFERANVRGAARLHATSDQEANALAAYVDRGRICTIPNGVDLPAAGMRQVDVRAKASIQAGDPIVLFLGRIHPIKRLDLLASAVVAVRRDHPRVRLVVVGADEGHTLRTLEAALAPLGDGLRLVGHVEDEEKWAWLRQSTVAVCCSDSENFGMATAEAMAAGVAVVVTRTCPWPQVESSGAGFWVEQRVDAIAASIAEIVANPVCAREMGTRGRALIEQSFGWRAMAARMIDLYEEVVRDRVQAIA